MAAGGCGNEGCAEVSRALRRLGLELPAAGCLIDEACVIVSCSFSGNECTRTGLPQVGGGMIGF